MSDYEVPQFLKDLQQPHPFIAHTGNRYITMVLDDVKGDVDSDFTAISQHRGLLVKAKWGKTPKVGDTLIVIEAKNGRIRGLVLNQDLLFYHDDLHLELYRRRKLSEAQREKLETFERQRADLDATYRSLPRVFKMRIDRFRREGPNFRINFESYDMMTCQQATIMQQQLIKPREVKRFAKLDYSLQKLRVAGLDEGHSGNSFGFSCRLAYWYAIYRTTKKPRLKERVKQCIIQNCGALAPLVGSDAYKE